METYNSTIEMSINTTSTNTSSISFKPELRIYPDAFRHVYISTHPVKYVYMETDKYAEADDYRMIVSNIEFILAVLNSLIQEEIAKVSSLSAVNRNTHINNHYLKQMYKIFLYGYFKLDALCSIYNTLDYNDTVCEQDNYAWDSYNNILVGFNESFENACRHMVYCTRSMREQLQEEHGLVLTDNFILCDTSSNEPIESDYLSEPQYLTAAAELEDQRNRFNMNGRV